MTVNGRQLGVDWSRLANYSGPLEDVTSFVDTDDIVIKWGRNQPRSTEDSSAAELSFALTNNTRQFSTDNQASPIAGDVLPGTPVRYQVTDPATAAITTLFAGPIDRLDDSDPKTFSATCLDGWGRPGDTKLSTAVYQGMRTGDLIGVVLDAIGWPAGARDIDPGATLVPNWWAEGQDAATAIEDLVHSEGAPAIAYVMGGVFVFRDRHHRLTEPRSLYSQGTYTHLQPAGIWKPVSDTFSRSVSSAWGTADTGQAWTTSGGVAADFNVSGGAGTQSHSAVNVSRRAVLASVLSEQIQVTFSVPVVATGAALLAAVTLRNLDPANDHYRAQLAFGLAGAMTLSLVERTGGADSTLATVTLADTYAAGTRVTVKARMDGQTLRAKAWLTGGAEPDWQVSVKDATIGSGYPPGVRTVVSTGNTNTLPVVFSADDVIVTPTDFKILTNSFRYRHGLDNIVNSATLEVSPRLPTQRQVVWSTQDMITLGASETQVYAVKADDPFVDLQLPSALIAYLEDGTTTYDYHLASGAVASMSLSRTSGQSALLTITAGAAGAVLDTGLRVRGTPLRPAATRTYTQSDPSSANRFGANDWGGTAPWAYYYDADVLVQRIVSLYSQARPSVTFDIANIDPAHLTGILAALVGNRVTVREDERGINGDFMVEQLTHTIVRHRVHRLTVGAEVVDPVQASNPFTFDVAGRGFDQGAFAMAGVPDATTMFQFDVAGRGFDQGKFAA